MKPLVLLLPLSNLSLTRKKATTLAWPSFFAFDEFTRYNLAGDEKGRGPNDPKKRFNLVKQGLAEDRVALAFLREK